MKLIEAAATLHRLANLFEGSPDAGEPWAESESSFLAHFGESYNYLLEVISNLDDVQMQRFDATMRVNPEAAVLWALAMEPTS